MCGANSKRAKNKGVTKSPGKIFWLVTEQIFFSYMESGPRGMFWTKERRRFVSEIWPFEVGIGIRADFTK